MGAVHTGNLNTIGFTNTSSTEVIEIDSITLKVLQSRPLPAGYCTRMPPRGGAGTSLPLEFDFEADQSAGRPGDAPVSADEWTFPLTVTQGADIGFETLGDRRGFEVGYVLEFEFRQGDKRYSRIIGTREEPFRTSSCSAAKEYHVWKSADDRKKGEVFTLTKVPFPTTRDPFRRDNR